jgi:transporter family-2 protein
MRVIALLGAFIYGVLVATQTRTNGELTGFVGSGIEAAVISFGSGLVILSVMAMVSSKVRGGIGRVIYGLRVGSFPRWQVLGGVLGGFFVGVQTSAVPAIGVALFTVAVVAGQLVNSLVVDRVGLSPAGVSPITPARLLSAFVAIAGVVVAVSDRFNSSEFEMLPIVLALTAGAGTAIQQGINGRLGIVAENSFSAAWFNFVFGTTALGVTFGILILGSETAVQSTTGAPWWAYAGGVFGVIFIATAVWVVPRIGVLLFALVSVSGQLAGALLLDIFAPTDGTELGPQLFIGVGITGLAIALSTLPRLLKLQSR